MFTEEEVAKAKKEWDNTLLGVVLGVSPSLKAVQDYVDVNLEGACANCTSSAIKYFYDQVRLW